MRLPPRPTVYEINTAVWLTRLGAQAGRKLTLSEVPGSVWDALAALPVDAVWLMGVWERSPAGLRLALENPGIDAGNHATLPDLTEADVIGSPYCVRNYAVDARFGGREALSQARRQLAERGVGLILDYVPNHVAPDHPWCRERPDCLIAGSEQDLAEHPDAFIATADGIFARGRDPYFPPWPDVVQLNAFSPVLRETVAEMLIDVGAQCDGLRCDMAMLMTKDVFARTWGERGGAVPQREFWPELIGAVKAAHPDLLFIAEAYWDMEWALQQQGFDLCYDKRLYDRLLRDPAEAVRAHLQADPEYQERLIRFIENHDEPRAAAVFARPQARAAAIVISTLPGARMYHDGQLDGRRVHIPVFLGREPDEPLDGGLRWFYERLLKAVAESDLRDGDWRLCETSGWPDNSSCRQLVSWCWSTPRSRHLVVVNLAPEPAQARVGLPWEELAGSEWALEDRLDGRTFKRDGDELASDGFYVELGPWEAHFLSVSALSA